MRQTVNLLLAAILAVALGAGAVAALTSWRQHLIDENPSSSTSTPLDRVSHAIEGLRRDGVHVTRDGRSMLSVKDERRLEQRVAAADVPVRIVVWAPSRYAGANYAREQVERAFADDEPGVAIIWEGPQQGSVFTTGKKGYVSDLGTVDLVGEPSVALAAAVVTSQDVTWFQDHGNSDYWGGTGGGIAAGVLFAGCALVMLWVFAWVLRLLSGGSLRLPGRWR